jgi:hypothetical protein
MMFDNDCRPGCFHIEKTAKDTPITTVDGWENIHVYRKWFTARAWGKQNIALKRLYGHDGIDLSLLAAYYLI